MAKPQYTHRQLAEWLRANGPISGASLDAIEIPVDDAPNDPGAPREYSNDPPDDKQEPTASDRAIEDLRKANEVQARELREAKDSERYWADRAKQRADARVEPEIDDTPTDQGLDGIDDDTPDKMLDDLSVKGIAALKERGLITEKEMTKRLEALEARLTGQINATAEGSDFDRQMGEEFPDLKRDNDAIETWKKAGQRGNPPQTSELYQATGRIYQTLMGAGDVSPAQGRILLKQAAILAQKELGLNGDTRQNREDDRRDRVMVQRGTRGRGEGEDTRGRTTMSAQQMQVAKHLGVSNEDFAKMETRRANRGRN